jgi:hypothetical protein
MAYATINKPNTYFNTVLYTGNGTTLTVTGVNFKPDLVWMKDRTVGYDNVLQDAVRGTTKIINSDQTYAEFTNTTSVTSFTVDGFTTGGYGATNASTIPFVSWNWLGSNTTTNNTSGTISSTVCANTTSGFSVVKWTGTGSGQSNVTIGHGIGAIPKMILFKQLDAGNWVVYHNSLGINNYVILNNTDASATATGLCNPTSTNIVLETSYGGTNSSAGMIAYCFAEVKGFSKMGSYLGNGSTNGTFIYTGFKPAFTLIKRTSSSGQNWPIFDDVRNTYNPETLYLYAGSSAAEGTENGGIDYLSNGFKIRNSFDYTNTSGATYIYMAFAENPLVGTNNVPTTAR